MRFFICTAFFSFTTQLRIDFENVGELALPTTSQTATLIALYVFANLKLFFLFFSHVFRSRWLKSGGKPFMYPCIVYVELLPCWTQPGTLPVCTAMLCCFKDNARIFVGTRISGLYQGYLLCQKFFGSVRWKGSRISIHSLCLPLYCNHLTGIRVFLNLS